MIAVVFKGVDKSKELKLFTNYFKVESRPDWAMYQYRVDFSPPIDNIKLCKGLIYSQEKMFGTCVFDGTLLFTTRKLQNNVSCVTQTNFNLSTLHTIL